MNLKYDKLLSNIALKCNLCHYTQEEQIHTNTQLLAENSQKQVELKAGRCCTFTPA